MTNHFRNRINSHWRHREENRHQGRQSGHESSHQDLIVSLMSSNNPARSHFWYGRFSRGVPRYLTPAWPGWRGSGSLRLKKKSLNKFPALPAGDVEDLPWAHAELLREFPLGDIFGGMPYANLSYLFIGQLGPAVSLSLRLTSPLHHIVLVVLARTRRQMIWVRTGRIVAGVTDFLPFRDRADEEFVGDLVSLSVPAVRPDLPIPARLLPRGPNPAVTISPVTRCLVNVAKEFASRRAEQRPAARGGKRFTTVETERVLGRFSFRHEIR